MNYINSHLQVVIFLFVFKFKKHITNFYYNKLNLGTHFKTTFVYSLFILKALWLL